MTGTNAPLLTFTAAAAVLGKDPDTVARWAKAGMLPTRRDPDSGRLWIPRAALEQWLTEGDAA